MKSNDVAFFIVWVFLILIMVGLLTALAGYSWPTGDKHLVDQTILCHVDVGLIEKHYRVWTFEKTDLRIMTNEEYQQYCGDK